jgi:hypothetical protein
MEKLTIKNYVPIFNSDIPFMSAAASALSRVSDHEFWQTSTNETFAWQV